MKFGLIKYEYMLNIGNEIQSIAAKRFLPKIDYYIEHEKLNEFNEDNNVNTIMNGYFLDCMKAWPPSRNINPLLISMHFSPRDKVLDVILSKESKDYLNEFSPVGCRDVNTQKLLNDNGIDAYFSGCLTLTLDSGCEKRHFEDVNDYILVNCDNSDEIVSFLKSHTQKDIYVINQEAHPSFKKAFPHQIAKSLYNYTSYFDAREKFFIAENLLKLYENANCIITDRLHCALPSLALKTPVLLFNSRQKQERFNGLNNLLLVSNFKEYSNDYKMFDVNNPPQNSDEYLKIRKKLIKSCKKFTGHINDSCYSNTSYNELLDTSTLLLTRQANDTRQYIRDILTMSYRYENQIKKKDKKIDSLKRELEKKDKIIDSQNQTIEDIQNSNKLNLLGSFRKKLR